MDGRVNTALPTFHAGQPGSTKPVVCGAEFFDSNKQWQSLTFKDIRCRADSEKRLAMFIGDRERGILNLPKQRKIPPLAEYGKQYLELYSTAKEATLKKKIATLKPLTKYLGHYCLDKLSSFLIEKYRIERQEKDKTANGTVNDEFTTLNHLFNKAIQEGIVDKNPCKGIKRLKKSQSRDRILTSEEISLLLTKLQEKDRMAVFLGLFCGIRLKETITLTWDNFDFQKGLLSFVAFKTGKLVTVPLSTYLVNELVNYKTTCTGNRLFETRDVTTCIVSNYSTYFSNLFKDLGIPGFTYHGLRHTFASLQGDLGTGVITTKEMLGHSSLDMTLRYSHTGLDSKRRAIEAMTAHVLNQGKILQLIQQGTA